MKLDSVDVLMCTWNSNKPYFRRCLKSIKREIPVHHFLVIDRFSSDGTVDVIKEYFEPTVIYSKENLATARRDGIDLVDTRYFIIVDDDIELPIGWFKRLTRHLDVHVGAVHEYVMAPLFSDKWMKWVKKTPTRIIDVTPESALEYGMRLDNTILRTDAVKDWKPSPLVSAYEDFLIVKHIVSKGYIWRIVNTFSFAHHRPRRMREYFRRVRWHVAGGRVTGFEPSLRRLLVELFRQTVHAFRLSLHTREPRIFVSTFLIRLVSIDGYLRWKKFIVLRRS